MLWKQVKDQEAATSEAVQCIQQTITALQKVRSSRDICIFELLYLIYSVLCYICCLNNCRIFFSLLSNYVSVIRCVISIFAEFIRDCLCA